MILLLGLFLSSLAMADVNNPVAFIGQAVLGSTAGAPLSAGATNLLASGISTSSVNATVSTTTTSTSDVLIGSMTLTPVAGTYFVNFSSSFEENNNNANIFFSIYSGGAQVTGTEVAVTPQIQGGVTPSLNMRLPGSVSAFATVNGAQAIEARWRVSAGTGTARQRILNIIRVQ